MIQLSQLLKDISYDKPYSIGHPSKWIDKLRGQQIFLGVVGLMLPCMVPQRFSVSSVLSFDIRYAKLIRFAIQAIPQKGFTSYKGHQFFPSRRSYAALYDTPAFYGSHSIRSLKRAHQFFSCLLSYAALYGTQAFWGSHSIRSLKTDGQVMRLTHLFGVITLALPYMVCISCRHRNSQGTL